MNRALTPQETLIHYSTATISAAVKENPETYADRLLVQKFKIIAENYKGGLIVDLCCGSGIHLLQKAGDIDRGIGIDFVSEFIDSANAKVRDQKLSNLEFIVSDARSLPLENNSVDLLYSLAALYVAADPLNVIREIARVLKVGGRCVIELGNIKSLNVICNREYPDTAPLIVVSVPEMLDACRAAGLRVTNRHSFQILPMWADKPRWLRPLLAPFWADVMKKSFRGYLVDEWVSSLPILNRFAFRQVIVCTKV